MHLCMKIPRHTSKNPIAAGDFKWIFARNCEGTEQLRVFRYSPCQMQKNLPGQQQLHARLTSISFMHQSPPSLGIPPNGF